MKLGEDLNLYENSRRIVFGVDREWFSVAGVHPDSFAHFSIRLDLSHR